MRTKLFPLVVVCLLCLFSAHAQNVLEKESSLKLSENLVEAEIVVENPSESFDGKIELEILDTKDQIQASKTQNLRIEKGKKTYKIPIEWDNWTAVSDQKLDWFRLHYRIGEREGFVSFSELVKDIFELRVITSEYIFQGKTQQIKVRAVHPVTGLPVKNVKLEGEIEIELDSEKDDDEIMLKAKGETDGEGFALLSFKIPENIKIDEADLDITGRKNGIERSVYEDFQEDSREGRVLLTTDKPIYQPEQDFKVRGLYFDADNTVVADSELEFKIFDEANTVLFKETVKTSAFGIASVSWKIPENAKLGSYRVKVKATGELDENQLYFKVSRYDLPNFSVTAKPDKTFYLPTDKQAEIAVTADYLFGKPVTKGKVRVVQESERKWNWRKQKYDVTEKGVFEGEADKDGKYIAKVDLKDEFADLLDDDYDKYEDLHFSAYYTDLTTNRTEQKRFDVRISKEPIHIYFIGKTYDLSQKLPISAYISTFYADGTPTICDVEVKGKNDDEDDKKYKTLQHLKTNKLGAGKLYFSRPSFDDDSDDLDLLITARDKNGQKGTYEREIEYYDETEGLKIETDKTVYKPGESVKAKIVSSKKEGFVYVEIVKDWTSLESLTAKLKDGKAEVKIPYAPQFSGDLTIGVYTDEKDDGDEVKASRGIIFPKQENLKVDAKFEKAVYKPNEDAKIDFSSLDGSGKPIETALGVVIFDKAVEERARTDADFGSYFSRYSSFLGYNKSFGGITLKDLNDLNLSKEISPETQLAAEVMLANNYFYPRVYHSWFNRIEAKSLYAETFKKQFTPIEDVLKTHFEKTGEYPFDETSLREILRKNNLDFDKIRDVWGNLYKPSFSINKTQEILTWKTAGADKVFPSNDDFDVSTSSFSYFQPIGKIIDKTAENYYKQTGKYIRDRETLRAELAKQNIVLDNIKDRWNHDYQIYFEVSGANYVIRFYSYGANGSYEPRYWSDDFDVWKTSQNYFYKTEQKIVEILGQTVNNGKRPFPQTAEEFQKLLKENDLPLENIKDGFERNIFLTINRFSRYSDKTVIENGKEKITPVTEEVVTFNIHTKGSDGVFSNDDAILATFSGTVSEQSKDTNFKKTEVKSVAFTGEQGAIRGNVSDASGAVVAGATITVTNQTDTAKTYSTTTDEDGKFLVANLPTGTYRVRIDYSGFKSFVYENLEVKAQNILEIKATLEAGSISEVVTVSADVAEVNTVNASVSMTVSSQQIQELPKGTNFVSLLKLAPGVAKPEPLSGGFQNDETTSENSTPRLREYFPETLLWSPEVVTDKNGKAQVKFKLADNITTWKLYTIASTKNGKIGVAEKEIQAFQPFFVDLDPPKFLTEGDEIHLPTQVRNYTDAKQKVDVSMSKSDWFSFLETEARASARAENSLTKNIEVASGASENAIFGFKATSIVKAGKQKVTAIAAKDSDAIEKPVTVRPNGQEIVKTETRLFTNSANFDVNFPANALTKTQKAELKIYPNLMSHVSESVQGLLQRPYGCGEQTISSTYPNLMILKFKSEPPAVAGGLRKVNLNNQLEKTALRFLQKGYERLLGYQVASGGFSYWGGKEEADIALTAYALRFLNDAKNFVEVDDEAIKKAQNWLASQQRTDGSFTKKYYWETVEDTKRTKIFTSYVARTLAKIQAETRASASVENPVLEKALAYLKIQNARIDEPYALALYGLSLLDAKKADEANSVAEILTKMAIPENNGVYWNLETNTPFYGWGTPGRVETTALVVQFLIKNQEEEKKRKGEEKKKADEQRTTNDELISKGTLFLLKNKDRYGVWYSTQTTVNVLDAFLAALSGEKQTAENQQIQISLNGKELQTLSLSSEQIAPVSINLESNLNENENRLEIVSSTNSAVMAQVVQSHYIDWKDAQILGENTNNSRQLQLDYRCDKQNAKIMEEVSCSVKAERIGFKGYGMLLAEIGIPPGADVSRESLQAAMDSDWSLSRYDILPDRIVIYMWSKAGGTNINFKFKPRYGINANTPASFVYDYYNDEAKATLAPMKFEVK